MFQQQPNGLTFPQHNLQPSLANGTNILKDMSDPICDNATGRQFMLPQHHNTVPSFQYMSVQKINKKNKHMNKLTVKHTESEH